MIEIDRKWLKNFNLRLSNLEIKRKRIRLEKLWEIFGEVLAHRPDTAHRRQWLLECLRCAEREKLIVFPKRAWENFGVPPLPRYVERILETPAPINQWWKTDQYWHQHLEWVLDLKYISTEHGQFLLRVDEGLKKGWFERATSLNRRSVELTGDEKRLKKLLESSLFAEGRLNYELLNVTSNVMPLAHEFVGTKPIALVFENRQPFNVALPVLESMSDAPYGILAFGSGNSFTNSVGDFIRIQNSPRYRTHFSSPLEQIHYVGDLDWAGLGIARRASRAAQKHGLPPLVPASHIHKVLLDLLLDESVSRPNGFPNEKFKKPPTDSEDLIKWLPTNIRSEVLRILNLGNRIPEEMLTDEILLSIWS